MTGLKVDEDEPALDGSGGASVGARLVDDAAVGAVRLIDGTTVGVIRFVDGATVDVDRLAGGAKVGVDRLEDGGVKDRLGGAEKLGVDRLGGSEEGRPADGEKFGALPPPSRCG